MSITTAVMCIALNVYHEARGEPLAGKVAVTQVVLNRVKSPLFPNTPCEVVKQGHYDGNIPIINQCQFSWWCDGKSDTPKDIIEFDKAISLAQNIYNNYYYDITEGSIYYHSINIEPYWARHYTKTVTINNHVFYH